MNIKKVIVIEDSSEKYMDVFRELKKYGIERVFWANNAEKGITEIENAETSGKAYDLLISDMHFDFFGEDDWEAGVKTMVRLWEGDINIPIVFCSSQNWKIDGAVRNIFYQPSRNWESELKDALNAI